jgi:hypothetical protein
VGNSPWWGSESMKSRTKFHSFHKFLVKGPILEKGSLFNYYSIPLFSEEPQKILKLG